MISITLFLVIVIGFIGVVLKEAFSVPVEGIETSNQSFNRKRYPKDVNHNPNDLVILSPAQKITQLKDCTKPNISHSKTLQWDKRFLGQLDWKLFEDISMEYLRIKNCDAAVTCTGADGGVDIKVKDNNDNVIALAQCKAWSKPIGVNLIRELFGVMASERVKNGIFLTTSIFSNEARQFAQGKPLVLIDGEEFIKNINALDHNDKKRIN